MNDRPDPTPSCKTALHRLLVLCLLPAAAWSQSAITYVPGETVTDPDLRRELESIGGEDAVRFVLAISDAPELAGVDACIPAGSREGANDRALCRAIGEADVLVLRGGSFLTWSKTVHSPGMRTHLGKALTDFLGANKPVIAYGGACEFLSGGVALPMAEIRAELGGRRRNPREVAQHRALVALAVGPPALFDADTWESGSARRLMRALWRTHVDVGLLFLGEVALRFTREERLLTVLGPGEALVFDLTRCRRGKGFADGVRLHRLIEGDGWNFAQGRPTVARERQPRAVPREAAANPEILNTESLSLSLLSGLLLEQVAQPARKRRCHTGKAEWTLSWDRGCSVFGPPESRSVLGLPLSWREIRR